MQNLRFSICEVWYISGMDGHGMNGHGMDGRDCGKYRQSLREIGNGIIEFSILGECEI